MLTALCILLSADRYLIIYGKTEKEIVIYNLCYIILSGVFKVSVFAVKKIWLHFLQEWKPRQGMELHGKEDKAIAYRNRNWSKLHSA